MALNIPYDAMTLRIAVLGASRKLEAYEKEHGEGSVLKKMDELGVQSPDGAEFNKQACEYHGVSMETYINSPNYETLKTEFAFTLMRKLVGTVKDAFGLEDKEAWGLVLHDRLPEL